MEGKGGEGGMGDRGEGGRCCGTYCRIVSGQMKVQYVSVESEQMDDQMGDELTYSCVH